MNILLVVDQQHDWSHAISGAEVVAAHDYLTEPRYADCAATRVFNLCHATDYQSAGYYVSMLAEARGHQPYPDLSALAQDDTQPAPSPAAPQATIAQPARERLRVPSGSARSRDPARLPAVAILRTPGAAAMPSNPGAIGKFQQAATALGMHAELVTRADSDRIAQFDALFIRDTTHVNDYTYRIACRAAVDGLVVMDDPDSIVRCSNKVFLHELMSHHRVPTPATLLVHRDNLDQLIPALGLPFILKQPDSAFSMGVLKIASPQQLQHQAAELFGRSELLLAQEYLPTAFDWRIGVLDRKPLFACRYHMAAGHWQVIKHEGDSRYSEGQAEAVMLDAVPEEVLSVALQAANLIGDGFYGVDLKHRDGRCYVIEVNDNPNVDAGNEDGVLQERLYHAVMAVMRARIEAGRGKQP